jgi:hypothetical protein
VPTLVRPRTATLCLRLDPDGRPADSDLSLATRDGEVVWRGQASPGAWVVGLRMRDRCTGSADDALWLLTRALLEVELAAHGLHRDGRGDLRVDVARDPQGTTLRARCGVHPVGLGLDAARTPPSRRPCDAVGSTRGVTPTGATLIR